MQQIQWCYRTKEQIHQQVNQLMIRWFKGKENEEAPYAIPPVPITSLPTEFKCDYSHTVGGAGIVLEPSGNKLLNPGNSSVF